VPGSKRLAKPSASEVNPGNSPWILSATFAGSDRTTCDLPCRMAFKIRRAARSTSIDSKGKLSARLNQVYSASCRPLNVACSGLPVRINPGQTVVTRMPDARSSARSPSERPTSANLLELYGKRCGTLTLPPMEAMLTMRPSPLGRICGSTARMTLSGPQKFVDMSRSFQPGPACATGDQDRTVPEVVARKPPAERATAGAGKRTGEYPCSRVSRDLL